MIHGIVIKFFVALNRQTHIRVSALALVNLPNEQSSYKKAGMC
jgi:hypothetical protein